MGMEFSSEAEEEKNGKWKMLRSQPMRKLIQAKWVVGTQILVRLHQVFI